MLLVYLCLYGNIEGPKTWGGHPTTDDVSGVANAMSKTSAATLKAIRLDRVGLAAQSYVHYFQDGAMGVREMNRIRNLAFNRHHHRDDLLHDIGKAANAQYHLLKQAQYCAKDSTDCMVISIDTNLALRRRDSLLQHLTPTVQRFSTFKKLRSALFAEKNLLPTTASLLATAETDGWVSI